jgi:hypothetical protein
MKSDLFARGCALEMARRHQRDHVNEPDSANDELGLRRAAAVRPAGVTQRATNQYSKG